LEYGIREQDGRIVVDLAGEIDLEHSPRAREILLGCVKRGLGLYVDLSAVTYIDSSGVASLVEAFQATRKQGTDFGLVGVSPPVRRVLALGRLDQVFPILDAAAEEGDAGG
jgi:anti-sigma B factor antagonist